MPENNPCTELEKNVLYGVVVTSKCPMQKSDFFRKIQANIAATGYHVTVVTGGALPRYAYTIGGKDLVGAEFVFAGGEAYSQAQVGEILQAFINWATQAPAWQPTALAVGSLGHFSVVQADASWSKRLLLGAFDYYQQAAIPVWQIVPDSPHRTLDIPDMSSVFDVAAQPVWQWLARHWDYPVPEESMAITHLPVLFGQPALEVMRWETEEWEIFAGAGPEVPKAEMRIVPLGVLLGLDTALERAIHLPVGKGLWRAEGEREWHKWA
ncbi:MAG: DUF4262 domain-containing protein [Janthinobacterium lividum]